MNLESYLSHESVLVKCQLLNEHEPVLLLLPVTLSNPLRQALIPSVLQREEAWSHTALPFFPFQLSLLGRLLVLGRN